MELFEKRKKIGNKIRELRESGNWTQAKLGVELAKALKKTKPIASATISRYEEGKRSVKSEMLDALAGVFKVKSSFFYEETGMQVSEERPGYDAGLNTKKLAVIEDIPFAFPDVVDKDIAGYAEFPRFMFPGAQYIIKVGDSFSSEGEINEGDHIIFAPLQDANSPDNLLYKLEGIFFIGRPPKKPLQAEILGHVLGVIKKM
jgi:transcriptional regulator with XRE-family HTH domain